MPFPNCRSYSICHMRVPGRHNYERKTVSQNDHVWKEATLRVVVLGILLDKRLGFFDSSLVVFRLQSCANGFQCRFARHGFGCRSRGRNWCLWSKEGRLADTSQLIVIVQIYPAWKERASRAPVRLRIFTHSSSFNSIPLISRQTISSFNKLSQSLKNCLNHPEVTCDKTAVLSAVVILKLFIYLNLLHHAQ